MSDWIALDCDGSSLGGRTTSSRTPCRSAASCAPFTIRSQYGPALAVTSATRGLGVNAPSYHRMPRTTRIAPATSSTHKPVAREADAPLPVEGCVDVPAGCEECTVIIKSSARIEVEPPRLIYDIGGRIGIKKCKACSCDAAISGWAGNAE